jgi:nucleotide-binding universal stress UspA family protein
MTVLGNWVEISLDHILFATDFSPASEKTSPYVEMLAHRYGSKVQLVHVVDLSAAFQVPDAGVYIDCFHKNAETHLEKMKAQFTSAGVEVESTLCEGDNPAKEILQIAKAKPADLIVAGTRGQSGLARLAFGSTAEQLVHHAECPVLAVGPDVKSSGPFGTFGRIVYATDFSPEAAKAAAFAFSLAQDSSAHIYLCHVIPAANHHHRFNDQELTEQFMSALKQLIPDIVPECCEPECIVEHGYAADGILLLANRIHADLIILGTRRLSHWFDTLKTGVAYEVIRAATCPVLTVRG